jgi:uncharacterized membrane protein YhaH (DUF805 family)
MAMALWRRAVPGLRSRIIVMGQRLRAAGADPWWLLLFAVVALAYMIVFAFQPRAGGGGH